MSVRLPVTEHVAVTGRHRSFYLSCGDAGAPLLVFVHGWPELAISWRRQLQCFAALGFRAIAPDMRGYGRSSVHPRHEDYAIEHIVRDMIELLDHLGRDTAVWIGHDWGAPVAWNLAAHHPERCVGVAALCVPYHPQGFGVRTAAALVDREIYPENEYPVGQWDYHLFYEENFARACAVFEADVESTVRALFRKGNPSAMHKPARTASVRRDGGWFGGADRAPDVPMDRDLLDDEDLHRYASALSANGFFGPGSWYMNAERNAGYAALAVDGGRLSMPVLFFHGAYDNVCETLRSRLAEPMRAQCANLTEVTVASGHWMAHEQPVAVNAGLASWIATRLPAYWPRP